VAVSDGKGGEKRLDTVAAESRHALNITGSWLGDNETVRTLSSSSSLF
jgi:hypothetical protein